MNNDGRDIKDGRAAGEDLVFNFRHAENLSCGHVPVVENSVAFMSDVRALFTEFRASEGG